MGKYTVKSGESWASISRKLYGGDERYFNVLMSANAGISMLHPGMVINTPNLSGYIAKNKAEGKLHNVSGYDWYQAQQYNKRSGYDPSSQRNTTQNTQNATNQSGTTGVPGQQYTIDIPTAPNTLTTPNRGKFYPEPGSEQPPGSQEVAGNTYLYDYKLPGVQTNAYVGQYGRGGPTRRGFGRDTSRYQSMFQQRMRRLEGGGYDSSAAQQRDPSKGRQWARNEAIANAMSDYQSFWNRQQSGGYAYQYPSGYGRPTEQYTRDVGRHRAAGVASRYNQAREVWRDSMVGRDRSTPTPGLPQPRNIYPAGGPQGPRWEGTPPSRPVGNGPTRGVGLGQATAYEQQRSGAASQDIIRGIGVGAANQRAGLAELEGALTRQKDPSTYQAQRVIGYQPIKDEFGNTIGYEPVRGDYTNVPVRGQKPADNPNMYMPSYLVRFRDGTRLIGGGEGYADLDVTPTRPNYVIRVNQQPNSGGYGGGGGGGGGGSYSYPNRVYAMRPARNMNGSPVQPAGQYRRPSAAQYRPPASRPAYRQQRPDPRAFIGATSWRIF